MKKLMITALVAGHLLTAAQPALAADLVDAGTPQMGAFGGVRLRVPLDGNRQQRQVRAGLAFAPMVQSRNVQGESRLRIGEGVELGIRGRSPVTLSLAGAPLSQHLGAGQDETGESPQPTSEEPRRRTPDERQQETGRKILKGAAVVALIGGAIIGGLFLMITVACDGNRCDE